MITEAQRLLPSLHSGNRREIGRDVYAVPTARFGINAAGTYYINLAGLCKPGVVNFGLVAQTTRVINLSLTLDSEELVIREPAAAIWSPDIAISVNEVTPLVSTLGNPLFGNMMRITASGAGVLILGSL